MEENNNNPGDKTETRQDDNELVGTKQNYLCKFTIDGEVLVERAMVEGRTVMKHHDLKTAYLLPVPPWLDDSYMYQVKLLHTLIEYVKKNDQKREVPITRKELFRSGADKTKVRKLIKGGYLKMSLVHLIGKDGKKKEARSCVYYTPQGRALVRDRIDPDYAKTENLS